MSMLAVNETAPSMMIPVESETAGFQIYHISYLWYTLVGSSICIIVSLIASYIIGGPNKPCELNPNLLAPFVRKLIRPRSTEAATNKAKNVIEISFQLKRKADGAADDASFWSTFHGFVSSIVLLVLSAELEPKFSLRSCAFESIVLLIS